MSSEPQPATPAKATRGRRLLGNLLKVLVSGGLIVYLFLQVDLRATLQSLTRVHPLWLLMAFVVFLLSFVLRALRWRALVAGWGAQVPLGDLLRWYLVGSFFNSVLPTGFGGDVLRVYELAQRVGDPIMAANSVIVDRYLGILVLLGMGLAAVPFAHGTIALNVVLLLAGLFMASLMAGVLLLNQGWWRRFGERLPLVGKFLAGKLAGLEETARYYSLCSLLQSTALSLAFNIVMILFVILLAIALEIRVPLVYFLVFIPITSAALMLPSVGGLGVREISYVSLFTQVGVAGPVAASLSLLVYLNALASGVIGGAIYLLSGAGGLLHRPRRAP